MAIIVFGSLNMDLVVQVPHLPQAGETLLSNMGKCGRGSCSDKSWRTDLDAHP